MLQIIAYFVLSLSVVSCATPRELQYYPERNIERPYTLPEGLNTWKILFTGHVDSTLTQSSRGFGGIFPFNWEQGLTDKLTLIWSPLPLQLRYQLFRNSMSYFGIYFNFLGPTYSRGYDFNWSPILHFTYRRVVSSNWAVETKLISEVEINRYNPWANRTLGGEIGFWLQPLEVWSFAVKKDLLWESGDPRSRYFGLLPPSREGGSRVIFPWIIEIQGMISNRLQLELEYQNISIKQSDQYWAHQVLGSLSYFW